MSDNQKIRRRQRCPECGFLDVIKWGVRNGITLHPRSPEARMLRSLVMELSDVESPNDKLWWLRMYRRWVEDNAEYACEKGTIPNTGQTYFIRKT